MFIVIAPSHHSTCPHPDPFFHSDFKKAVAFALFCLRRLDYTNNDLEVGICELSVSVHETHVTTSVSHNGVQCLSGLEVLAAAGE